MRPTSRVWLILAALNGLLAVAAGAFGAHGVSDPQVREWLRTGAAYQLPHAAAAVVAWSLADRLRGAGATAALFGMGALLFGGSLDLLALTGARLWGAVTPLGGLLLMAGWGVLIWSAARGSGAMEQPTGRPATSSTPMRKGRPVVDALSDDDRPDDRERGPGELTR